MSLVIKFAIGVCVAVSGNQLKCDDQEIKLSRVNLSNSYGMEKRIDDKLSHLYLASLVNDNRVICIMKGDGAECSADFTSSLNNEMIEWGKR